MIPVTKTLSNVAAGTASDPIVLDIFGRPEVSLQVAVTGTVNWSVQQTVDRVENVIDNPSSATWFLHPDTNMVAQTVQRQGNYAYLPTAVRIVVNSGSGSVVLTALQAGLRN